MGPMKKKYILVCFLFIILCSFSVLDFFYKKTYVYKDITGSLHSKITWLIKKKKDNFVMDKKAKDGVAKFVYSPKLNLEKYSFEAAGQNTDFTLTLDKKRLVAEGISKGKKIYKELKIYSDWIQDFNFGLRSFLDSSYLEKRFVIVNPKDFMIYEMLAFKKDIGKVDINGKSYKVQKIEITLPGFKSRFWKAEIWYDLNSSDLIKYKANEGPGTPTTVVTFVSKS